MHEEQTQACPTAIHWHSHTHVLLCLVNEYADAKTRLSIQLVMRGIPRDRYGIRDLRDYIILSLAYRKLTAHMLQRRELNRTIQHMARTRRIVSSWSGRRLHVMDEAIMLTL